MYLCIFKSLFPANAVSVSCRSVIAANSKQHIFSPVSIHLLYTMASVITKLLSPSYYQQQWKSFLVNSYNYYNPMFRSGRFVMMKQKRNDIQHNFALY